MKLYDLKAKDIISFANFLTTNGRCDGTGGLSQVTARKIISLVRTTLDNAVNEDLIKFNPAIRIKIEKSKCDIDKKDRTVSILFDKGWDIGEVREWLRHADIDTTANIYTHVRQSRAIGLGKNFDKTFTIKVDNKP